MELKVCATSHLRSWWQNPMSIQEPGCDAFAVLRRVAAEGLDPERALVVAVEHVLPGEADPAVDLDRALARRNGDVARVRLRGGDRDRCLLVAFGHAPGGPVRERPGELGLDVGVGERVRDGLVDADRAAELLARLRMLD